MAFAPKRRGEPGPYDLQGQVRPEQASPEREDIGVVVLAAVERGGLVVTHGRQHPRHFVGSHARADPGAIDDDASPGLAICDQLGDGQGKVRVIDQLLAVRAAVDGLVPLLTQGSANVLL